ncbi:MAG: NDP-hexose 2,3-dehydratase family protein [Vicinamibacterales bacterium]
MPTSHPPLSPAGHLVRASSVDDMRQVLSSGSDGFVCEPIAMRDATAWRLTDGAISHVSGGFFSVVGVTPRGDDEGRPLVLLYQPQSAFNGLVVASRDDELFVLLQARVEPGNLGVAQYGPTVQSTPANYLRVHGGRPTPYLECFQHARTGVAPVGDWTELDLGSRYLLKNKRLVCVEAIGSLPVEPGFLWVPASLLKKAVLEGALMNTDLRSMLAVMPWSQWPSRDDLDDVGRAAHTSLARRPRPAIIGGALAQVGRPRPPVRLVPLTELDHWDLNEYGLFELEPAAQGFDVQFFRIEAPTREVPRWTQPLLNSRTRGRVVLALAVVDGALQALVHGRGEPGLSTGAAMYPTYVASPGGSAPASDSAALEGLQACQPTTLAHTLESDEGGRFFRDESDFELVLVDEAVDVGEDYRWVTLSELKCLLGISNVCSIQLRCIASMLLALL